ncbi:MAG: MBG domain-containing protein, partial [Cyclobacteriaceae bacterium]
APFSYQLEAYGSVTFVSEMTESIHTLSFQGDETGLTFAAEGASVSYIYFEGDGTWDLLSNVAAGSFRHWHGTVNYNSVTVDCSIDFEIGNGAGTPELNFGSSTIYCRDFNVHPTTTPTLNEGTSNLTITRDFDGSGVSLNSVTLDGTGGFFGSSTFEHLTVTAGSSATFESGETLTVNQSITMDGTKANPINISSDATGVQTTLSMASGTANLTYLILQDLAATGGATFNATQTIDNGNNSGWNITGLTGSDYYWVGNSGNWSDFSNHWATTSGGSTFETTVPGVLDNIIFDANSFSSGGGVVTVDSDEANLNDLDASASTMAFTISGGGKELNVYGSVNLPATVTSDVDTYNFLSVNSESLDFNNGPGTDDDLNFVGSGTWSLGSSLSAKSMTIESGVVTTNSHDLTIKNDISFLSANSKTLTLGSSTVSVGWLSANTAENVTFNGGSSDITIEGSLLLDTSPSNSISLNNLTYLANTNAALLYDDLSLNDFTIEAGVTLKPVGDLTVSTTNFSAVGTAIDPIIFEPQTGSSSLTISQASGTVNAYYLEMEEVTAEGGATFNAFSSIDNGGVIGWVFSKTAQTISFQDLEDKAVGDPDFELSATASSSLPVTFTIVSGSAIITGTTLSITGGGTIQVKAEQAGDINYHPAPSVTKSFEVERLDQTITFDALPAQLLSNGTFELMATGGGSIAAVTYASSNSSVATVSGSTVTFVSEGTTTITASQLGDDTYNDAAPVDQELTISEGDLSQTITFAALDIKRYNDEPFGLTATASSSLDVSYVSSNQSVATISGSTVTILSIGSTTITASQLGDDVYNAASDVQRDLTIDKGILTATAEDKEKIYGDANPTLTIAYSGFVNSDDESILITIPTVNTSVTSATEVGAHAITIQGGSAENYDLELVEGEMTIEKRVLTATADDLFIHEGDAIPELTISYAELVNGDEGSDIDIAPAITTTAGAASPIGTYPITLSGGEDTNYMLELVNGTLTIDVELSTGNLLEAMSFYPNPTKDFLFIDRVEEQFELEIWSLEGKLLDEYLINGAYTIDLRSREKGTYLLVLKNGGGLIGTNRLIVE